MPGAQEREWWRCGHVVRIPLRWHAGSWEKGTVHDDEFDLVLAHQLPAQVVSNSDELDLGQVLNRETNRLILGAGTW